MKSISGIVFAGLLLAQASGETRIDTFDKKSNRTGYIIIDTRSGRLDQFDTRGNRLGFGTTTPNPSGRGSEQLYDRNGRPVSIDQRTR